MFRTCAHINFRNSCISKEKIRYQQIACNGYQKVNAASNNAPKMPHCEDSTPPVYKGPSYESLRNAYRSTLSPSLKQFYKTPLLLQKGKAQWVWDHDGKRYLDMFGGIATVSVGHSHPKLISAMTEQASKLGHTSSIYIHSRFYEYAEKLTSKLPPELSVIYLTNSGSEANELAFQMARLYTKEQTIVSLRNCYHGGSYVTSATTAMRNWRQPIAQPAGHIHTKNPDVYRGPWGGSKCRDCPVPMVARKCDCTGECLASKSYVAEFEDVFEYSLPSHGRVAAFVAESIQGIGGVVQYPKTFLRQVYDAVRRNGGLCVADEVQTGFARTGEHFWGFEGHAVTPDIVTMAKGIGNGFPLGAVATRPEIADELNQSLHFNTFGGNPVACAVGKAVLEVIEEEELQKNALNVGTYLLERLGNLAADFPEIVGDVRGKGLMIGVDLVSDSESKKELGADLMAEIFEDIKDMGVLLGRGGVHSNVLRIKPPLCVTEQDADFTVDVIRNALLRHRNRYSGDKESVFVNGI